MWVEARTDPFIFSALDWAGDLGNSPSSNRLGTETVNQIKVALYLILTSSFCED